MTFETNSGTCSVAPDAIVVETQPQGLLIGHLHASSHRKRLVFYSGGCLLAFAAAIVAWVRGDWIVTVAGFAFGAWMLQGLVASWRIEESVTIPIISIDVVDVVRPARGAGCFEVHYTDEGTRRTRKIRPSNDGEFLRGHRLLFDVIGDRLRDD